MARGSTAGDALMLVPVLLIMLALCPPRGDDADLLLAAIVYVACEYAKRRLP